MDTSVWIDYLGGAETEIARRFVGMLDHGYPVGITSVIYQEVIQGVSSREEFDRLSEYLSTQRFYHPRSPITSYQEAALLYFRCRREGVTIRSTIDCLIARIAIDHELLLLHDDRDFDRMARVISELQLA